MSFVSIVRALLSGNGLKTAVFDMFSKKFFFCAKWGAFRVHWKTKNLLPNRSLVDWLCNPSCPTKELIMADYDKIDHGLGIRYIIRIVPLYVPYHSLKLAGLFVTWSLLDIRKTCFLHSLGELLLHESSCDDPVKLSNISIYLKKAFLDL
jgi:hypothetical protein